MQNRIGFLTGTSSRRWLLGLVLLLNLAVCFYVWQQVVAFQQVPFDTDEANHALGGVRLAHHLMRGDWQMVVQSVYQQDFYPPGMDAPKAAALLLFGFTPLVVRTVSVLCLFAGVWVLVAFCMEASDGTVLAGLIAAVLALTARPLLLNSTLVMLEIPGLLVSLLFLWAYLRAVKRPSRRRLLLASAALAWMFLTKYTYGVIGLLTLLLFEVSLLLPRPALLDVRRRLGARWVWLLGPLAAVLLLWFGRPETMRTFFDFVQPQASGEALLSTRGLLYYPRSLALHSLPSPWFALVTAVSLLWAAHRWYQPALRLLLIYFVVGMGLIMFVNHPVNPRFIATIVPAAYTLTGLMLVDGLRQLRTAQGWRQRGTAAALTGVLLLSMVSIPAVVNRFRLLPSVLETTLETEPTLTEMAAWVATQTEGDIYLVNYFDQFSPATLTWHLTSTSEGRRLPTVTGAILAEAQAAETAVLRRDVLQSSADYLVLVEGGPWGHPFWPDYTEALAQDLQLVGRSEFAIDRFNVQSWLDRNRLTPAEWVQVKQDGRYTLQLSVIVYEIVRR